MAAGAAAATSAAASMSGGGGGGGGEKAGRPRGRNSVQGCQNFMRQFRDAESRELKQLTAQQFMEVWDHYDDDGEIERTNAICS